MAANSAPGTGRIMAYAAPSFAYMAVAAPIVVILPTIYSKHAQVSVTMIGTIFLLMRIFDAITDPLIGYLSDRTQTRIGSRKPWIIAGGIVTMSAVYFLFLIPEQAGAWYFGTWSLLFYLGMTMFQIPHLAWGSELVPEYDQRARVFGIRAAMDTSGALMYTLLPMLLVFIGVAASTEYRPEVLRPLGIMVVLLIPVLTLVAVVFAPTEIVPKRERPRLRDIWFAVLRNKPMLRFLSAYIVSGIGYGFFAALIFPFLDSHLKVGDKIAYLLLAANIATLVSLPLWTRVVSRIGKHRTWASGWIMGIFTYLLLALAPQGEGAVLFAFVSFVLIGFSGGASLVAPFALLADIVDYDLLKTHVDRAGNYYSFIFLIAKITASAGGLALMTIGFVFGYSVEADAVNDDFAQMGMVLSACLVPAFFQLIALPLIWNFPIDKRRHGIIRKRLDQRIQRSAEGC